LLPFPSQAQSHTWKDKQNDAMRGSLLILLAAGTAAAAGPSTQLCEWARHSCTAASARLAAADAQCRSGVPAQRPSNAASAVVHPEASSTPPARSALAQSLPRRSAVAGLRPLACHPVPEDMAWD
jgi:hypothetical protein